MTEGIAGRALCPQCRLLLGTASDCVICGVRYPVVSSIRVLLPDPPACIARWRMQLGLILKRASATVRTLASESSESGLRVSTQTRLRSLARSIAEQAEDVARVVGPPIGGMLPPRSDIELPRGAMDYMSCLFRDWAWSDGHDAENDRSLAAIRRVTQERALGRTLVLGAGGCRLAYDLHVHCGGTQTAVVDIDPYLLVIAEAVIRGASVDLTESSVNAPEVDPVSRRWKFVAPSGPLDEQAFHFFLANGTEPPFAEQSFDTIVTPWFIDQVPTDLEGLLRRLHGLLVPGGRWVNHGPLIYPPGAVPITRWYGRQEILELAASIGFRVGACETASEPHLVSALTGRGLIENVVTFEGVRE